MPATVGFARESDLPALKEIWSQCFGGPEAYRDFYYSRRFKPEDTLVARADGQAAAMLTLMAVTLAGEQGCYIYAVATLPRFQGQGLQQMLGEFSIQEMRRRGMKFCCLVPADPGLFSFYSKFGYQADFFRWEKRVTGADIPPGFKPILFGHCGYKAFAALREGYLGRIGRAAAHPEPELRYIYDELCNFQGAVVRFTEDGQERYAAYNACDGRIYLQEQSGRDPEAVVWSLMLRHGIWNGRCTSAEYFPGALHMPYGMGRLLDRPESPAAPRTLSAWLGGQGYMSLMLD